MRNSERVKDLCYQYMPVSVHSDTFSADAYSSIRTSQHLLTTILHGDNGSMRSTGRCDFPWWCLDAGGGGVYGWSSLALEEAISFSIDRWSLVPEVKGMEGCNESQWKQQRRTWMSDVHIHTAHRRVIVLLFNALGPDWLRDEGAGSSMTVWEPRT